jgi:hypothetical protein
LYILEILSVLVLRDWLNESGRKICRLHFPLTRSRRSLRTAHSLPLLLLRESRMPVWKVCFIFLFACVCLGLTLATIVVPLALSNEDGRWLWFGGCLAGTLVMGTLFALYLRREDRTFHQASKRSY